MINTFVAIDVETTGLSPERDHIIEIGAVKVIDGKVTGKFSELLNPGIPIPEHIVKLTGITDAMLAEAQETGRILHALSEFLGNHILLGHNVKFDYSFIKEAFAKINIVYNTLAIDTLILSRKLHKEIEGRSLGNMCIHYGIKNEHAHRAYDDAKAAACLYLKMLKEYEKETDIFEPQPLQYNIKKRNPMTVKQKKYLNDLLKYHRIYTKPVDNLSKNEASRMIDKIILQYGRMR